MNIDKCEEGTKREIDGEKIDSIALNTLEPKYMYKVTETQHQRYTQPDDKCLERTM